MKEPWRTFGYCLLVLSLPLAFWYALWPHRRRLDPPRTAKGNLPAETGHKLPEKG